MPHIFSPHLANVPFLSDNRIATCQQVGNSRRLRDVLVFFFLRSCPWLKSKSTNRKKTDKSYSCFYVDSIFENGKITVFPILIISLENESHTAEGPRRPLPHLPGTVVSAHEWVPPPARGCAVSPFCRGNPRCPRHGEGHSPQGGPHQRAAKALRAAEALPRSPATADTLMNGRVCVRLVSRVGADPAPLVERLKERGRKPTDWTLTHR